MASLDTTVGNIAAPSTPERSTITARPAGRLDGFLERVRDNIAAGGVAGFDESGLRVEGRLHCVCPGDARRRPPLDPGHGVITSGARAAR